MSRSAKPFTQQLQERVSAAGLAIQRIVDLVDKHYDQLEQDDFGKISNYLQTAATRAAVGLQIAQKRRQVSIGTFDLATAPVGPIQRQAGSVTPPVRGQGGVLMAEDSSKDEVPDAPARRVVARRVHTQREPSTHGTGFITED